MGRRMAAPLRSDGDAQAGQGRQGAAVRADRETPRRGRGAATDGGREGGMGEAE